MALYVGIRGTAFGKSKLIDLSMGYPEGTTLGKLAFIWGESQQLRLPEALPEALALWAGIRDRDEAQRFIAACSADGVRFFEPTDRGKFVIVGNDEAIRRIEKQKAKSSRGGFAKAQKAASGTPQAVPEACDGHATGTLQAVPKPCPRTRTRTRNSSSNSSGNPQGGSPQVRRRAAKERHWSVAEWLQAAVKRFNPCAAKVDQADLHAWAEEVRRFEEVDQVELVHATEVLKWAFDDAFWRNVIASPSGLRRNWPKLEAKYREHQQTLLNH